MTSEQEAPAIPPTVEASRQPVPLPPPHDEGTFLRIAMIAGGLLLIGLFVAPRGRSGPTFLYSWDLLANLDRWQFAQLLYLVAVGVVLLVAGLMPLPRAVRGVIGLILGGVPILASFAAGGDVSTILIASFSIGMSAALFHHSRAPGSPASRIIVVVGCLGLIAAFAVPFDGAPRAARVELTLVGCLPLVLLLSAPLSLMILVSRRMCRWTQVWGVGLMTHTPVSLLLVAVAGLFASKVGFFDQPAPLYQAVSISIYFIMASVGLGYVMSALSRSTSSPCG